MGTDFERFQVSILLCTLGLALPRESPKPIFANVSLSMSHAFFFRIQVGRARINGLAQRQAIYSDSLWLSPLVTILSCLNTFQIDLISIAMSVPVDVVMTAFLYSGNINSERQQRQTSGK